MEIVRFEDRYVRKTEHNGDLYFAVEDLVAVLTDSVNPKDYIKKMRSRDPELSKGWGQIVTPLSLQTAGGPQKINCANLGGCFRIIQSIPSPKAEPIKLWLAQMGYERIQEIENPEIAQERMMEIYRRKGYDEAWIHRRIQTIKNRKELTNEWGLRGAVEKDYEFFTALMSRSTFGITPIQHKEIKKLGRENLRDNMTDIELALVNIGELTAKELHRARDTKGRAALRKDVLEAGTIAGNTRRQIEKKTGRAVISKARHTEQNLLSDSKKKDT
ncbi:MAG: Bro-N domain-containing protein [Rickettsiales bacterium]|jgi:hypothetical protein|nr:Bro-N domain-containing protein [Rickettsiales bacterium]